MHKAITQGFIEKAMNGARHDGWRLTTAGKMFAASGAAPSAPRSVATKPDPVLTALLAKR